MEDLTLGNLLKIQREEYEAELALHRAEITQLRAEIERLREARLEDWRAGREAAADCAEDYCSDMPDLAGHGHSVGLRDAIRALPEPKEASHD